MNQLRHYIRSVVPVHESADVPDREYLDRFARNRDESAFAALVGRYGGSVWAVCRRLVDREQDAEDAFQATFLTLARKAGSIRDGSLPAWLHGVARRIAANLRRTARRQADREAAAAIRPCSGPPELTWQDGLAVLDEELGRLPERYRTVLIVCCLDGRSREEAAAHLGWSEGQVKGRLERARDMLRRRLERRGFQVGTVLLAATVSRSASAGPPAVAPTVLVSSTVKAAIAFVSASGAKSGTLSSTVAALSEGVVRAMAVQKIKLVLAMLLALAVTSSGLFTYHAAAARANRTEGEPLAAPAQNAAAQPSDEEKEARTRAAEEAARRADAAAKAARDAAAKAASQRDTPTVPGQAKVAAGKADFEDVSVKIQPGGLANQMPETIQIRADGTCGYRIEERPARGTEPKWDAAYLEHKLSTERLRSLEASLKKTDWLTKDSKSAPQIHSTKYTVTLKRNKETRAIVIEGGDDEPYRSLIFFFRGIALQENFMYRLERLPVRERNDAFRQIDQFVRAETGGPYGKPQCEIDLRRFLPTFQRCVRYAPHSSVEELAPAVRLLGHLRSEADREYIVALANDRDLNVRTAVAEALGRLGGKESLPVLRRMVRSTEEAAWQLVRLGPLAVPTVVEVIESGTDPEDERNPEFLDYQKLIRAYIDHWKDVPKPIDPRVLAAVRKSMTVPKIKGYGIQYHRELLDLASRPTLPK